MSSAVIALLLSAASLIDVVAPGKFMGRWGYQGDWETEERDLGDGRKACVTYSKKKDRFLSSAFFMFGARNEVGFLTKAPISASSKISLVYGPDARATLSSFDVERVGAGYIMRSRDSTEGMGKFLKSMRAASAAHFVIDGTKHDIPMAEFAKAYEQMQACERHRLGMVLRD